MNPYLSALGTLYLNLVFFVCIGQKTCLPTSYPGRVSLNTINGKGLEGVVIRINNLGSERTRTGSNGNFQYKLSNCPGTRMRVEVSKDGYSVVNQIETFGHVLTQLPDLDPSQLQFPVIMCLDKDTDTYRLKYYSQIASFTYDNETAILRDRINQLEKRLTQNGQQKERIIDSLAVLKVRYQETTNAFSQQQQQVQQIAKLFANLSTADIDTTYQKAFDLYQKGKLNEAQELLNSQYLDDEQKVYQKEKQLAEQLKQSADRKKRSWLNKARLKGTLFESQFDFTNALLWYERAILEDSSQFDPVINFANFLFRQQQVNQSEKWYNLALWIATTANEKSNAYNRLGNLYVETNRLPEAEKAYLKSWEIIQEQPNLKTEYAEYFLAFHLTNLGNLYTMYKPFAVVDSIYQRALNIREKLAKSGDQDDKSNLALTLINLGGFYTNNNVYPIKSEIAFHRALTIYEKIVNLSKEEEENLGTSLGDLGNLYFKNAACQLDAELYYQRAINYYELLAKNNFERFGNSLAILCMNLGNLYVKNGRISEADSIFRRTLIIYEKLIITNPDKFESGLSSVLNTIGIIYDEKHDESRAKEFYERALIIQEKLYAANPSRPTATMGSLLNNIGTMYQSKGNLLCADSVLRRALSIYEKLSLYDSSAQYALNLSNILINLSGLCIQRMLYKEAFTFKNRALIIREKLTEIDPDRYKGLLSITFGSISWNLLFLKQFSESEKTARKGLELDPKQIRININLAHALLFQGKLLEAKNLYRMLKDKKDEGGNFFKSILLNDLAELEKAGIYSQDLIEIRKILE